MRCINVLLDIPAIEPSPVYTYSFEDKDESKAVTGRRVLAELGRRKMEGWIVGRQDNAPAGVRPKKIVKIFDELPVFNDSLWKLAQWISETNVCPLNMVIKAMLPPRSRSRAKIIIPGPSFAQKADDLDKQAAYFLSLLEKRGHVEWSEALLSLSRLQIEDLKARGYIKTLGWAPVKEKAASWQYVVNCCPEGSYQALNKKAPRQAAALRQLLEEHSAPANDMERNYGKSVLQGLIEKGFIRREPVRTVLHEPEYALTGEQEQVLRELEGAALSHRYREALLFGVTGSGKTEIYLRIAQKVIAMGRQAIILVPEIALTRHLTEVFSSRIPNLAVLHSRMAAGERVRLWSAMAKGEIHLVLGTRLAVFAPLPDVGLIILDEEQENSFKQEESPRYHARETARRRAEIENSLLLLGSATPSLESFRRASSGEIQLLQLKERVGQASLPEVEVVDMRRIPHSARGKALSPFLIERLEQELEEGRQSILFINRRGHTPLTICRMCGKIVQCAHCSVALTYHSQTDKCICHYCGFSESPRQICPGCGSSALERMGIGTQRIEEEVKKHFPWARVRRLDIDSSGGGLQKEILAEMAGGRIDILIGTQMVAKGLDFPGVSLVGIVDADGLLNLPDFRSGERGFQLMVQAAGRAGRGNAKGSVIIQTYNPDHYVVKRASCHDYIGFFKEENEWRKTLMYPPYTHILRVVSSSEQEKTAALCARAVFRTIEEALDAQEEVPQILGPAPCPLARINKRFRHQILVKSPNILLLSSIGRYIINKERPADARIEIDVDPLATM